MPHLSYLKQEIFFFSFNWQSENPDNIDEIKFYL